MNYIGIDDFILSALKEDIGTGDITTQSCIPADAVSTGRFLAKADGVFCGGDVLCRVFFLYDPSVSVSLYMEDGAWVNKGDVIATVQGSSQSILSCERVALNIVQHMSGIATYAKSLVEQVAGTKARIVDTRKSTPGMRVLEKYAVKAGGAGNHRFNLADGVLIKDNHIAAAGGIGQAIAAVRANVPHTMKIEVEVETMDQVQEALEAGADIIMLDNMDCAAMKQAVDQIAGRALTEASGNMGERDLRQVAETGVDIISVGALTHSVTALDISLKF